MFKSIGCAIAALFLCLSPAMANGDGLGYCKTSDSFKAYMTTAHPGVPFGELNTHLVEGVGVALDKVAVKPMKAVAFYIVPVGPKTWVVAFNKDDCHSGDVTIDTDALAVIVDRAAAH
jgi:hypothetical protein